MVSKKTRRNKTSKKAGAMTIPELKRAFEKVEAKVQSIRSLPMSEQVKEFQSTWKDIFGRELDKSAAEAYLKVKKVSKMTRKAKKTMKGGAAPLAGAPIDYQTRPGIDGVHGQFPAYLDKGLIPYPEPGITQECGTKDFTATPLPSASSNQVGGASGQASFGEFTSALTFKPFESTVPSTFYQDIRSAYLGNPLPPSPAPEDHIWKYK